MENKEKRNIIIEKSFSFSVRIVELYKLLRFKKNEYVLSKQILKSGTSIGANIAEAQEAQSKKDFISKLYISIKETSETKYWLKLLTKTKFIDENYSQVLHKKLSEIHNLLTAIIKTSKEKP